METIKTTARIHPLMAAAAVSVIIVSAAGAAALTGLLPNSRATTEAPLAAAQMAPAYAVAPQAIQPAAYVQPAPLAAPAPVIIKETIIKEVPVKVAAKPRHVTYAHNDAPAYYAPAPRPAPQPNYVAIGTGAVVGGLLGNQVGGGNGRKLATIAGVIGGGMLGNQIANQNR
jgi:uncharacterized protein YcfJ